MKAIINANVVLRESILIDGVIILDDDKIVDFGDKTLMDLYPDCEIVDAQNNYIGPGLVDIHTHAGGGRFFYEDFKWATKCHLENGTTSLLPALYYTLSKFEIINAAKQFRQIQNTKIGSVLKGLYMEGPYLNPKYGCEATENKWSHEISKKDYSELIEEVKDITRVWCIAPELEGIEEFVKDVNIATDEKAIFSVAHSEATPYQVEKFIEEGLRLASHHTNATGTLNKYPECRGVCVDEAVNYNDEIYAELICDRMGIHVDPYMLRLIVKIKGKSKIILISDAYVCKGPTPNGYEGATDINFDCDGEIAGFKMTLITACQNMMKHTGASICDIFNYASYNPSKVIGLKGYGCIRKGNFADLIIVDSLMNLKKVILKGEIIC